MGGCVMRFRFVVVAASRGGLRRAAGRQREALLPEVLGLAERVRHPARQHEEQIGEPVHVAEHGLADRLAAHQAQDVALGAAADGAGLVQEGGDHAAARQDEGLERREVGLALVDGALEHRDLLRGRCGSCPPTRRPAASRARCRGRRARSGPGAGSDRAAASPGSACAASLQARTMPSTEFSSSIVP